MKKPFNNSGHSGAVAPSARKFADDRWPAKAAKRHKSQAFGFTLLCRDLKANQADQAQLNSLRNSWENWSRGRVLHSDFKALFNDAFFGCHLSSAMRALMERGL